MPKLCEFETCRFRATYGFNCEPIRCYTHKEDKMRLSCIMCKCGKIPNYNFEGLKPKFCIDCKDILMIDVKNPKCFCGKSQPTYNIKGLKPTYCSLCKTPEMIDLKHNKCFCENSRPTFNYEGLKPEYCASCRLENMVDITSKKCKCRNSQPNFNYEGLTAVYCSLCKTNDMVDVKHKKCKCGKKCYYNYQGKPPDFCSECKTEDMINVIDKKCKCGKAIPIFNCEGLTPKYCSLCKTNDMNDVKSTRCNCKKVLPSFNYEGLTPKYCASCKKDGMINVKDDRCKSDNCYIRGNKNYKGYCTHCFQHLFPLDPLSFQIRSKTKEIAVRDFINTKFVGFQHDKTLWYNESACDCTTKRRIDHRKLINETLLCIETDENQHKSYSKQDEEARYHDLFMAYGGKFIFIRFNPDKYKDEKGKSCNPMLFNRLILLEEEIQNQIKRIENGENQELLEIIELFFDKNIENKL
jgi:hypothetical protein